MVINLLSNPRNVSTALMYSFNQHPLIDVIDEPFYAHYLVTSGKKHPGREEIIVSQPIEIPEILSNIRKQKNHVFIKNMAHHLIDIDLDVLLEWTNIFLIRDPKLLISSFSRVIPNPSHDDIGIKQQFKVASFLKEKGQSYIVLDSGELLKSPYSIFKQLFQQVNLPFYPTMLSWEKGPIKEDGVWAKYWYESVHKSTGFSGQNKYDNDFPSHLTSLLEECQYIYNSFYDQSIKA